jgi:hypothetical protein
VLLDDSRVYKLIADTSGIERELLTGINFPGYSKLSLNLQNNPPALFSPKSYHDNFYSYPVSVPGSVEAAVVESSGNVLFSGTDGGSIKKRWNALPDGEILIGKNRSGLIITEGSSIYPHGILGDSVEPRAISIVSFAGEPAVGHIIEAAGGLVFETLKPLLLDIDGRPGDEIIVTASDSDLGARLQMYSGHGELIAEGAPVGRGFRWAHLLSAAPFGPGGEWEIAVVKTPHIGGHLEYYRLEEDRLRVVHSARGFSTHRIGSRNLDMAVAGDFDGIPGAEILIPSQDFTELYAVKRTKTGSEVLRTISLASPLTTNIAACSDEEYLSIAFGGRNGVLYLLDENIGKRH